MYCEAYDCVELKCMTTAQPEVENGRAWLEMGEHGCKVKRYAAL